MNLKNEAVQFNEKHKWCGCLGIVEEVKKNRIMVGVPVPEKGTAYIFAMAIHTMGDIAWHV